MDLNTVANVATALTLLVALIFGVMQLRQIERRRRDTSAMETMHTFQTPELRDAFRSVLSVAEPMTQQTISSSRELADAAEVIIYAGESLGALVLNASCPSTLSTGSWAASYGCPGGVSRPTSRPSASCGGRISPNGSNGWWSGSTSIPAPGKARGAYISHRAWRP